MEPNNAPNNPTPNLGQDPTPITPDNQPGNPPAQKPVAHASMTRLGLGSQKFLYIVMLILGPVMLISSLMIFLTSSIGDDWIESTGTITAVKQNEPTSSDDSVSYVPTFTYEVDGVTMTHTERWATGNFYTIGQTVNISYDPNNPSDAKITAEAKENLSMIPFFIPFGIGAFLFGLYVRKKTREGVLLSWSP